MYWYNTSHRARFSIEHSASHALLNPAVLGPPLFKMHPAPDDVQPSHPRAITCGYRTTEAPSPFFPATSIILPPSTLHPSRWAVRYHA